jgi:diadenosine tetraphosphatase ApaH/serine/threonine PP2A family protein phosphatase
MSVRVAVLSDIHANIEAFQAVVRDLEHRADRILNLGDLVGYNASPNECVELAKDIGMHSIQGNHDQAACNPILDEGFNIYARYAILWTRNILTKENMRFLSGLADNCHLNCGLACHGTPESTFNYIGLHFQARAILNMMKKGFWDRAKVCLYGHTHIRKVWRMDIRGKVTPVEIPLDGVIRLNSEERYLLNPGSVGQPRNGDPRSSYLIFDTEENSVEFRLVGYDLSATMKKIIDAKLPEFLAERLMDGI